MRAQRALHLYVLAMMALSVPLLALLKAQPAFLAAHQLDRLDMIALTVFLIVLLPASPSLLYLAADRLSRPLGRLLYPVLFWLLLVILLLPLVGKILNSALLAVLGTALAASLLLWLYLRHRPVQTFLSLYALALPVIMGMFLFSSAIRPWFTSAWNEVSSERSSNLSLPPVVFVVLDELPLVSLLTLDGNGQARINERRFPGFARLATNATWYPSHTVNADNTAISLPNMLSGLLPNVADEASPTWRHHPVNLFTALAPYYALDVHQNGTDLCPHSLCQPNSLLASRRYRLGLTADDLWIVGLHRLLPDDWAVNLPSIDNRWLGFRDQHYDASFRKEDYEYADRGRVFRRFITGIEAHADRPGLHFLHSMLPHAPFTHLPDGRQYALPESSQFLADLSDDDQSSFMEQLYDDPQVAHLSRQQHLMQTAFADQLLGELLDRLNTLGLYDEAMIIITADHGASFTPGQPRRELTHDNMAEIVGVPLLIKYPNQQTGRIESRGSQSIDLLPTVLDVAGIRLEQDLEGESLRASSPETRTQLAVTTESGDHHVAELKAYRAALLKTVRQLDINKGDGPMAQVMATSLLPGSNALLDTSALDLPEWPERSDQSSLQLKVAQLNGLRQWYPQTDYSLSMFYAELAEPELITDLSQASATTGFAVSINDRVACLSRLFQVPGLTHQFRCLYDSDRLNPGLNRIAVTPLILDSDGQWFRLPDMTLNHVDAVTGTQAGNPARLWRNARARVRPGLAIEAADPAMSSLFVDGWSEASADHRWSVAPRASLTFRPDRPLPAREYSFVLHGRAFVHPPELPAQRVILLINGSPVAETLMNSDQMATYRFPFSLASQATHLNISLEFPDARRPVDTGFNPDTRPLGIALTHWQVEAVKQGNNPDD